MAPDPDAVADDFPDLIRIPEVRRPVWQRVLLVAGVVACFVMGIVGWLVPVVTGVPFYVAGLVLLAKVSPALGRRINAWERELAPRYRRWLRPTRWGRKGATGTGGNGS